MTKNNENQEQNDRYLQQNEVGMNDAENSKPSIMGNKNFLTLWFGQTVSNIGSFFAFIAILFFTLRISADFSPARQAQALALVTLIQVFPNLVLGPFSGVIVDKFDRKKIMIFMDILGAGTSFLMTTVSSLFQIYTLVGIYSIVRIFFYPAKSAALPLIVDPENLVQANSLSQMTMQLSKIIGPALSGFVVAWYGIRMAFIIDGVSFVLSALSIMLITTDLRPEPSEEKLTLKSSFRDLKIGFNVAFSDRVIRFVIITLVLLMIGASMIDPLFAFYLSSEFGLGEEAFGLIIGVSALTGFISAMVLSAKGNIDRKLLLIVMTMLVGGISIAMIGFAPNLPNPLVGLFLGMALVGALNVILMIPTSTVIQTLVTNENMGKVNGIMGALISLTQVGGASLAGFLVTFLPVSTIYMFAGIFLMTLFVIMTVYLKITGLDEISKNRQEEMIRIKKQQRINRNIEIENELKRDPPITVTDPTIAD